MPGSNINAGLEAGPVSLVAVANRFRAQILGTILTPLLSTPIKWRETVDLAHYFQDRVQSHKYYQSERAYVCLEIEEDLSEPCCTYIYNPR